MAKNAAAAASSAGPAPRADARRRAGPVRGLGIAIGIAGIAAVVLLPMTLLVAVLLVPTLVAAIVDRDKEKFAPLTVGALNLAGISPAVAELWSRGASLPRALEILADPFMWLFALAAAGLGWGLHILVPSIVAAVMTWRLERKRTLLEEGRATLAEEWGAAVKAFGDEPGR